ncbi:MAG: resolvase [Nitrosopumilaceae archaeon]|nr:resolvase [Nitrosopumilaceae archaeon]NIU01576.1 resolvase [Nitrosopumilaceae archaeon]NIU88557.1 resolvase [Nitrosopumilaceae archaeon]NIV66262.1 resolvase [Nitrosopumilaceae archaeon]NIX62178.1 resolvase [Nitrosopumilaceae archaeon]
MSKELSKLGLKSLSKTKSSRKENKKVARTRRQRGYHWEDTIVKRFNSLDNWNAFRLGSPSVGLPDILAINSKDSSLFTIEAKSGTTNSLQVPFDQIERCLRWAHTFELYSTRRVILAFKFLSKKRVGKSLYESRELKEYFKEWNNENKVTDCVCDYNGDVYALKNGQRYKLGLNDYTMPF